jgi:5-methylcytosine-specific restriction endonuclease McrA
MIRRYAPVKPSRGTVIPADMRLRVLQRDQGCVGFGRFPVACGGGLELDHVRASGGMGMKSRTEDDNLVSLCGNCHRYKTAFGRQARPILLDYLASLGDPHDAHVDPCSPECHRVTA